MVGLPTGTVTFLFSDVEGSTELLERLGDAYASELHEHRAIVREAVGSRGGEIVDQRGEETFAAFSDASAAVETAVEIERRHADHPMRVRIGLHTGQPALTGDGYLGLDVHRAARICGAGHGRQILLSAETRALVADRSTKDLGEYLLKGISAPEHLFQLLEEGLPRSFAALRVLPTARKSKRRPQLRRRGDPPRSLEQLAWAVRARLPTTAEDERAAVSRLAASLIAAARSSTAAKRFVASVDRRAIERDLESYRSMGVTSQRASEAADLAARRLTLLDALDERATLARTGGPTPRPRGRRDRAGDAGARCRPRPPHERRSARASEPAGRTGAAFDDSAPSTSSSRPTRPASSTSTASSRCRRRATSGTRSGWRVQASTGSMSSPEPSRHAPSDNPYQAGIGTEAAAAAVTMAAACERTGVGKRQL